jgi:hypothetical protein
MKPMLSWLVMYALMHVAEHTDRLVLSYPLWIGVTLLAAAGAFMACAVIGSRRIRRRWTLTVATAVAAWSGLYFATFNATLTHDSGSVSAFMASAHTVYWKDAADIYLEQRGSGHDWHIVVLDVRQRPFDFNVADLSINDRDRVMAYMVDRMPETAFARSPTLMKRQAPYGPRPVGLFSTPQT